MGIVPVWGWLKFDKSINERRSKSRLAGVTRRYFPRTRVHDDPVSSSMLRKLGSESSGDFIVPLLGQFAGLTVNLSSRSDCKLKPDGIVQVFAYKYLGIDLLELDVLVAGNFELLCNDPGVSH